MNQQELKESITSTGVPLISLFDDQGDCLPTPTIFKTK